MPLKVALVHDWLIHMRGGEKVLESLLELYPEADIFTLFYNRQKLAPRLKDAQITGSFLHHLPGILNYYRWLLPLFPLAIRTFALKGYDIVISSSHCVAKGIRVPPETLHICYCHTPVRYVWSFRDEYFQSFPWPVRNLVHKILDSFKKWDLETNAGVHSFVANSRNTSKRIEKFYGRDSLVIYPPVDTSIGHSEGVKMQEQGYLVVSALVPYKRIDLAVEAFNRLGYPLTVIGDGPEMQKLKRAARENVRFLGSVDDATLKMHYHACRALIFPGEEDFGIVPVEVQACGRPVIAYARGGALETVTAATGVFFSEQTAEGLAGAVKRFESLSFDPAVIREHARQFDQSVFRERVGETVLALYQQWKRAKPVDNRSSLATK